MLVHLVAMAAYQGYKYFKQPIHNASGNQTVPLAGLGEPQTTHKPQMHRMLLLSNSKDLEEMGVDCSKCEHSKIPPSDPQFYINILVIIGSQDAQ